MKKYLSKAILYIILFLAIFIALFLLVNLDLNPNKNSITGANKTDSTVDTNTELKSKLGGTTFSVETYDEWAISKGLDKTNNGLDNDPDKDNLPNYLEYVYRTDPLNADTDGDGFSDRQEITNGYDPDAPGDAKPAVEIMISKINIKAPMVWSQSETDADMLKDLEKGVNHYPKTAAPGQNGNMIISGHSSNYVWVKGDYNYIFKNLNDLEKGDLIIIKTELLLINIK